MFASKALPDRFPYRVGQVRLAYEGTLGGEPTVEDPRPFDPCMNNEPNPILVAFRQHNEEAARPGSWESAASPQGWIDYTDAAYKGSPVHIEHARRVLGRLHKLMGAS